jgi:hypothetical protein
MLSEYQSINDVSEANILSVYSGKPDGCRCECGGTYRYYSANRLEAERRNGYALEDSDINDRQVRKVLALLKQNADQVERINGLGGETIFDVTLNGRAYTVYAI